MAILELVIYPDERLRQICPPLLVFDSRLKELAQNMHETMAHFKGCGLAATQVGRSERLFLLDLSDDYSDPEYFVNPTITDASGNMSWNEACLSFPNVWAKTELKSMVTIHYQDLEGKKHSATYSEKEDSLRCAAIQHEAAHLDGILYIDALSRLKRERLLQKMYKSLKHHG